MTYLLVFILLLYCIFRYDIHQAKTGRKQWAVFVSVILVSIIAFRYRMGTDTVSYQYFFEKLLPTIGNLDFKNLLDDYKYEPGFVVYCSLIKTIFGDYFAMQIISAFFTFGVILRFFYKHTPHFFLSVTLLFFLFGFSLCDIIRQSIAMSIAYCALSLLHKENSRSKFLKYYLLLAIAFSFHYSSAIFIFIPLLKWLKVNTFPSYAFLIFLFLVGGFLRAQFGGMIELAGQYFMGFERASIYSEGSWYMNDEINLMSTIVSIFWILTFIVISSTQEKKEWLRPFNYLLFIYLCWRVLSINLGIFYRFTNYFHLFGMLYLAEGLFAINESKKVRNTLATFMTVVTILLVFRHYMTIEVFPGARQIECFYPYNSIFEQKSIPEREAIYNNLQ